MKRLATALCFLIAALGAHAADGALLDALTSPILFKGDANTGYRDPLLLWHDGLFHMFFTLGERDTNATNNLIKE